ncbi:uncharacterized protein ACN2A1_012094 [Glossina fuscipes fuscipes]|nr:hypothetical protein GQX74_008214 [Glossina fuscipes]
MKVYIYLILIDVTSVMTWREERSWSSGDKWSTRSGSGGSVKIINVITDSGGGGGGGGGGGDDDNDDSGISDGGNGGNIEIINFVRGSGGGGGGGGGGGSGENSRNARLDRSNGGSSSDQVDGDWSSSRRGAKDDKVKPVKVISLGTDGGRWRPFGSHQGVRANFQIFKVINLGGTRSTWSSGGSRGDVWSSDGSEEREDRTMFFKVINLTEETGIDGDFDSQPPSDWI